MGMSVGVGLVSGLNFTEIVGKLMELERRPVTQQQTRLLTLQRKQEAYSAINLRLNALRDALGKMDSALDLSAKSVNLSDTTSMTATANSSAPEASYSLEVLQLATNERRASQGVATEGETAIASAPGKFEIRLGSNAIMSIDVTASTTLADLRNAINDANGDVSATIVNDGTPTNPYRLILSGKATGESNTIQIVRNDTTMNFTSATIEEAAAASSNQFTGTVTSSTGGGYTGTGTRNIIAEVTTAGAMGEAKFRVSLDGGITWGAADAFTTSTTAQDITGGEDVRIAFGDNGSNFGIGDRFTIDAFNPLLQKAQDTLARVDGITIRRSSNILTNAIPGVTVTATKPTTSPVRLDVRSDSSNVATLVNGFVTAYNSLVTDIATRSNFDKDKQISEPLFGETTATSLKTSLSGIVSSGILTGNGLTSLASIGISTQRDGTLSVNQSKLSSAIADDLEAVKSIFATMGQSATEGISYTGATASTTPGKYYVMVTQPATRAEIAGGQVISSLTGLAADEMLTFTANSQSFSVTLDAGAKAPEIVDQLNALFGEKGAALEALQQDGELFIRSTKYGSQQSFKVVSNQTGAGQTGIGTVLRSASGTDVAGYINGQQAHGAGQTLQGIRGTAAEGLELTITATTPVSGQINVSRGVAASLLARIQGFTNSTNGILKARQDGLTESIEDLNDRIRKLEDRMTEKEETLRAQFSRLETVLAQFQSQGDFLSNQLSQISRIR